MSTEISVAFRDTTLFVVEHRQQPYVPMKPLVEGMGLDWASQFTKLKTNPRFSIAEIATQMPGDDQRRAVTCLPLRKLPGWLASIHPNKVRPEIRETVIAFQNECDDILWDAWQQRMGTPTPINPEPARLAYASPAERAPLVSAVRRLVKVAEAKGRPLTTQDAHSIVNLKLGVFDSEHLTPEQIPQALRLVGELWQSLVLEGEYLERAPAGQPAPTPPPVRAGLTLEQQNELTQRLRQYLAGWLFTDRDSAWVYNHLRVAFQVGDWRDIPEASFPAALALIDSKRAPAVSFLQFVGGVRTWFAQNLLGAGTPWTPAVQRRLTEAMHRQVNLPAPVDWLALAAEMDRKKGLKSAA